MRILHTSDWHLGRSLGDHRLLDDQARFLDWLVDHVEAAGVELVAVAGDLFDRSVPPEDAVALLGESFRRIRAAGAEVVAIAGNHDGAHRLAAYDGLTDAAGVIIRGGYRRAAEVSTHGTGDDRLAVVAVPFLDPQLVPRDLVIDGIRPTHDSVLRAAIDSARPNLPADTPTLVLAHAFVTGAEPCASERELAVGSAGQVGASTFEGFDYVALGHLHRPQPVDGLAHIRYSGTPLPYSFDETGPKVVVLADISRTGVHTEVVEIPLGRRAVTLRGTIDELLFDVSHAPYEDCFIRAELTDVGPVLDMRRRLSDRFPYVVEIERVGSGRPGGAQLASAGAVRQLAPTELAAAFWSDVTGEEITADAQRMIADAMDRARLEDAAR